MGCGGCRRNSSNSGSRTKPKKVLKSVSVPQKTVSSSILTNRKKKCSKCPFNTVTGLSGRCKKVNRLIERAIQDPNFKCPIKRF